MKKIMHLLKENKQIIRLTLPILVLLNLVIKGLFLGISDI